MDDDEISPDDLELDDTPWYGRLEGEQRATAVAMLRTELEESRERLVAAITADPEGWHRDQHFGFGLAVRNLLREHGYEVNDIDMDSDWPRLVEEAVREG